jgi:hypothetical protein
MGEAFDIQSSGRQIAVVAESAVLPQHGLHCLFKRRLLGSSSNQHWEREGQE